MKKHFLQLVICLLTSTFMSSYAQTYQIGHKSQAFVDASRSNRNITTEIYYPATTAGDNVTIATGQFPVVVFGHGFVMVWSAYDNIWTGVVPNGYIMVFLTTETGFSPSHLDFGKDIAFMVGAMKAEGLKASSTFYGAVTNKSAIMGHSMGGGSSFLAVQFDSTITAMATLAPANTNPSSITAAKSITIPEIIFSGVNDCVATPATNQIPMYDSLASACKTLVNIIGASHCQFANSNTNCSLGDGTCSPKPTITRAVQQGIVTSLLIPWLNFYLKNDCSSGNQFQSLITAASGITSQQNCTLSCTTSVGNIVRNNFLVQVSPNPFNSEATVIIQDAAGKIGNAVFTMYDIYGRAVKSVTVTSTTFKLDRVNLPSGIYFYKVKGDRGQISTGKIVIE